MAIGYMGWARAEWRIKREEYRADVELSHGKSDLRQRLIIAEQQLEWYRSRTNHPAPRRGPVKFTDPAIDDVALDDSRGVRRTATAQRTTICRWRATSSPTSPPPTPNGASPKPTAWASKPGPTP